MSGFKAASEGRSSGPNKITKEFVEGLPFAERDERGRVKQRLFWDSKLTGFGLLVGLQSKSFVCQREVGGRTVRETIGKFGPRDWAVDQARKEAQQRLSALARGERQPKVPTITLDEAWKRIAVPHLKVKQRSPTTIRVYEWNIGKHLSDWQHRPLAEISRTEARERHEKLAADPGKQTADLVLKIFSAIYNRALKEHDLPINPTVAVTFHEPEPPRSAIPAEKLKAWAAAVNGLDNGVTRDCLLFLLYSGLRKSRAMHLRWQDIDLEKRIAHIAVTKGDKPFDLPMSSHMIEIVKSREVERDLYGANPKCKPWVFPSVNAKSGHIEVLPKPKVAGLNWVIHDTRRTFITTGESVGVSPYALKLLVNHAMSRDITAGYMSLSTERLAPDMQAISDKLDTIIAGGATVTSIRQGAAA
jgi:integrase